MNSLTNKLYIKIIISLVIGFIFAAELTHIHYPCVSPTPGEGCVSIDKAIMHPGDLINNMQGSLYQFAPKLFAVSVISFAVMSIFSFVQNRNKVRPAGNGPHADTNSQ